MTTAEAIEGMTDPGEFEILATRVLRLTDDNCRLLEHTGVNSAGKTVPAPVDSFCVVPGINPPRFVMAAFTTARLESLERKWLFDHAAAPPESRAKAADDGDLVKAHREAEGLRQKHPDAVFVVHLCTNKQPDAALIAAVNARALDLGLEVRFLTQSRLRDFLDVDPDGQWLRKEHLGIAAQRLSLPLLRDLSVRSLQLYGKEFLYSGPSAFVPTSSQRTVANSIVPSKSVIVVTGASGCGKSVACYQVLREHLDHGGLGLWIPGEHAASATSLEEAIGLTLRSLHPGIEPGAGAVALGHAGTSRRLLLVIDDINRGGNPSGTLRKLLTWGRPPGNRGGEVSPCEVLVPAWDLYWSPLDSQFDKTTWMARIPVQRMEETEAFACLDAGLGTRKHELSEPERRRVVASLGFDPILIALYASSVPETGGVPLPATAHEVIGSFVKGVEREAAVSGKHLESEYDTALTRLAEGMLAHRDLYPPWSSVQKWLPSEELNTVRELAGYQKLCRVNDRAGLAHFEFRHDRIMEHFVVRALKPMLSCPESNAGILTDPYYTSFIGRALAQCELTDGLLRWVEQNAPLALVLSLRFVDALPAERGNRFADAAKHWLESAGRGKRTPPVLLREAFCILEGTDSQHVLLVSESLPLNWFVARARLANGDPEAGIAHFSSHRQFAPGVRDRALDSVLERALHKHRRSLVAACSRTLRAQETSEIRRAGALVLAGFIAEAELSADVLAAWDLSKDKPGILLPALWAGLRCAAADPAVVLDDMMAAWAALPKEGKRWLNQESVSHELQWALVRGIPEAVQRYLIAMARSKELLRSAITTALSSLRGPLVVRYLIEEATEAERRARGSGHNSLWFLTLPLNWDPTNGTYGGRLPPESIQAIRSCWESDTADRLMQEIAFEVWTSNIDDLGVLRQIPTKHPQYRSVLKRRASLGDLSVAPLIRQLISSDAEWFRFIGKIWAEQFRDVTDDALKDLVLSTPSDYSGGESDKHYLLAGLLCQIPARDAEPLLVKHWNSLRFSPRFIQTALYLGSKQSTALAAEAIAGYPPSTDPFKYITFLFGFSTVGLSDCLELRHLEVLLPHISRVDAHTLREMTWLCQKRGWRDWCLRNLEPEIQRRRAALPRPPDGGTNPIEAIARKDFPTDADLLEELDRLEREWQSHGAELFLWSEGFERRQEDHKRWERILEDWLSRKPTLERFRVFTAAVFDLGRRSDLAMLTKCTITGDQEEVERLRENARLGIMLRTLQ